jgi:hypothetical protein
MSRLLGEAGAGWVVPPGDEAAVATALVEALEAGPSPEQRQAARALAARFEWERALAPLVGFCRAPAADPAKEQFAYRPGTPPLAHRLAYRAGRFVGTWAARR